MTVTLERCTGSMREERSEPVRPRDVQRRILSEHEWHVERCVGGRLERPDLRRSADSDWGVLVSRTIVSALERSEVGGGGRVVLDVAMDDEAEEAVTLAPVKFVVLSSRA